MSDDAVIEKEKKSKKSVEGQEKIDTISDTRDSELSVNESQLVTFFLDKIEFSIDINKVKEIVRMPDIVKIPNAPAFIEGIANLRGTVLPILNTRVRFGLKRGELTDQTRILVIDINGSLTGLIVDSVKEVLRIDNSLVEPAPPAVKDVNSEFLKGVIKLNQGKRLILTIDVEKACMTQITKNAKSDVVKETAAAVSSQKRIEEHIEEELLVTFKLENEEFAFSIDNVNEIIRVPEITMVPSAPRYVRGVISLRNEILPIVDLRTFLDIKMREYNDSTRIMVVDI
ncbi:MAG TPA: chemotaxis protein CheW, partial [bacterium]|nr:chemotaxis protein CheW [bacterium]